MNELLEDIGTWMDKYIKEAYIHPLVIMNRSQSFKANMRSHLEFVLQVIVH